jgi:hypothetical protein
MSLKRRMVSCDMRLLASFMALFLAGCATPADGTLWRFDNLDHIGGIAVRIEGAPEVIATHAGSAVRFDGVKDALVVDKHPLAGAARFTAEAIFRPEGGAFEQRWMHLAEIDLATGKETSARFLFEIRVVGSEWYLDAFTTGTGYRHALMAPDKLHPLGRWYRVAMSFDGTMFRSYVDGVLQREAAIAFTPQGDGRSAFGSRLNRIDHFRGAVFAARFTPEALPPQKFLVMPAGLK